MEIFLIEVWTVLKPSTNTTPCSKPALISSIASRKKEIFSREYFYPQLEMPGFWLLCVLFLTQCYFSSISAPTSYLNSPGCLHMLPNSLYTFAYVFLGFFLIFNLFFFFATQPLRWKGKFYRAQAESAEGLQL